MPGESRAVRFVKPTPVTVEMASTSTPGAMDCTAATCGVGSSTRSDLVRTTIGVAPLSHASVR